PDEPGGEAMDRRPNPTRITEAVPVTESISLLHFLSPGCDGNVLVAAGPDGAGMIDDHFSTALRPLQAQLAEVAPAPLRLVVNTHWHDDHTEGNEHFGRRAPIVAHRRVRETLGSYQELVGLDGAVQKFFPRPEVGLPSITFEESLSLHWNG